THLLLSYALAVVLCASSACTPPAPSPPLFPYTTLFRSVAAAALHRATVRGEDEVVARRVDLQTTLEVLAGKVEFESGEEGRELRSEEHTSELQSRFDLVCRLLLEKKKDASAR